MSEPLAHMSLTETAEAIAAKRVSSREVVQACLARIEKFQPVLNSFVAVEGEQALQAAEAADAELARGNLRGPLHGVPLAHKDMFYRAGKVCACGSKIRSEFVPDHTCTLLARLEGAGALTLGRLNMTEFATGPHGLNEHFGHCRNPWNPEHITGGSSSGSGCAVAARLIYGALGSDTGGSVRLPAAFCGVVGLKPTYTRVSRHGMLPLSFSMDQAGPLTRTVRDCARMLGVIAGHDPMDATSSTRPVPDYEAALGRSVKGVRIGVPDDYYYEGIQEDVRRAMDESLEVFRALGAVVRKVSVPDHNLYYALGNLITRTEAAAIHRRWLRDRPHDYEPQALSRLTIGLYVPASRYLEALDLRAVMLQRMMEEVFSQVDVLHVPGTSFPAPTIEAMDVRDSSGFLEVLRSISHCTQPLNYLGLPALSVPAGFAASGLPVALQLVGRPFGEARLLNLGDAYQREAGWHERVPPV